MTNNLDSSGRLHGLDTLRAVAIVVVMLYHLSIQGLLPPALAPAARVGWAGVDLFFVLSGFLIGSQLLRPYLAGRRPSLQDFYLRRAFRILPAFFVVLSLYVAVPLWREAPGPRAAWQYATFLWNLLLLGYPHERAFSHVWSLCVEEHFYLVMPLLTLALMRRPSLWRTALLLLGLVAGGVMLRAWLLHAVVLPAGEEGGGALMMRYLYYPTYARLDGLVVGVALALVATFRPAWWSRAGRYSGLLALGGLAVVVAGLWLCGFDSISPELPRGILFTFPALAFGFGLLVMSAASRRGLLARRVPGASTLAALAFSLYLTHKSVAHATHLLLPRATADADWRAALIYAAACVGCAAVLYFGVERPFLALRVRWMRGGAAAAVDREVRLDPAV